MTLLSRIFGKAASPRGVMRPLWLRVVEIAREEAWYRDCHVADTLAGRFDMVVLVLALVLLRMEREEALVEPSVRLTELFVEDMDGQLRNSGVGDLSVGKHIGKLMGALGGRLSALREALAEDAAPQGGGARAATALAATALAGAVARNVTLADGGEGGAAAARVLQLAGQLDRLGAEELLAGRIAR